MWDLGKSKNILVLPGNILLLPRNILFLCGKSRFCLGNSDLFRKLEVFLVSKQSLCSRIFKDVHESRAFDGFVVKKCGSRGLPRYVYPLFSLKSHGFQLGMLVRITALKKTIHPKKTVHPKKSLEIPRKHQTKQKKHQNWFFASGQNSWSTTQRQRKVIDGPCRGTEIGSRKGYVPQWSVV